MKKLVLLFASLCLMATTAFAKEVATTEVPATAPVAAPAEMKPVSTSTTTLGEENGKLKDTKLSTAQKMALKMMKKPLKRASTDAGVSGGMKTAIIVTAFGLIVCILGAAIGLWLLYVIGAIILVVGLVLVLLELLG